MTLSFREAVLQLSATRVSISRALWTVLFAVCVALSCGPGAANASGWQPEALFRVGTLGLGPEVGVRSPGGAFGLRANVNLFSYSDDDLYSRRFANADSASGYDFDARFGGAIRLFNGGLTADYYPFRNGFRLSAGVVVNGDRITAAARPEGAARIGRQIYAVQDAGRVSLKALVDLVSPYVGFGYEGRLSRHIVAAVDAGILVEGSPRVSATAEGPAAALPSFQGEVERERRRLAGDLDVPVYPVIEIGIGYRF